MPSYFGNTKLCLLQEFQQTGNNENRLSIKNILFLEIKTYIDV